MTDKHGRWIYKMTSAFKELETNAIFDICEWECSCCHHIADRFDGLTYPYCPHCGTKMEPPIEETQSKADEHVIEYRPLYRPDGKLWTPNPDRFLYRICGKIAFTYFGTEYHGTKYYIENSGSKERDIVAIFNDEVDYDDPYYKWQATSYVIAGNIYQPIYFDDKGKELAGFAKTYGLAMTPEQVEYYEPIIEKEWVKKNKGA